MEPRDEELLRKVGQYYLQYKGVVDIEDFLKTLGATREVEVSNQALSYVYYYMLYLATKEAVDAAEQAKDDRLTYREFAVEYGEEVYGELSVEHTVFTYPMRTYAYYSFAEGLNAPEYSVLGYLLRKIYRTVKEKREELEVSPPELSFFDFFGDFDSALSELEELKEAFPKGHYRPPVYTDPDWLAKAYRALSLVEELEKFKIGVKEKGGKIEQNLIKYILWKVYEFYTFYLIVRYLMSENYEIRKLTKKTDQNIRYTYVAEKGDKRLRLRLNIPLSNSSLIRVDGLDREKIFKFRGRPDILLEDLRDKRQIIFECKYSSRASYITAGRFKVMAYTYEYDPLTAVLVYPGLGKGRGFDREDRATWELDSLAKKEGGVLEFQFNRHTLYMLILDPKEDDVTVNVERIRRILERYV